MRDVMIAGHRYRIRYKSQSGNYRWYAWEAVVTYLGLGGPSGDDHWFHCRPKADTGSIPQADLLAFEEVGADVSNRPPRRLKGALDVAT